MIGYLVLCIGKRIETKKKDWKSFFESPLIKKTLRGGSALDAAHEYAAGEYDLVQTDIDGYFIFETNDDEELQMILNTIPTVKAGGTVRIHALVED